MLCCPYSSSQQAGLVNSGQLGPAYCFFHLVLQFHDQLNLGKAGTDTGDKQFFSLSLLAISVCDLETENHHIVGALFVVLMAGLCCKSERPI